MSLSIPAQFARLFLRSYVRPFVLHGPHHPAVMRTGVAYSLGLIPKPFNVTTRTLYAGDIPIVETRPRSPRNDAVMFYIHGGGYVMGSPRTHQAFISRLANAMQCIVWSPDYRLAPEHPFPAGLEDTAMAWQTFASTFAGKRLFIGGESAGGGLSMAICLLAKERGFAMPDKMYLQSPWLDVSLSGESYHHLDHVDALVNVEVAETAFARAYSGHYSRHNPLISPVYGDLHGLPPIYVQVSDAEIFYSDSVTLNQKAIAAGVEITMEIGHGLWHAWPMFAPIIPEASASINKAAQWLVAETKPAVTPAPAQHKRYTALHTAHAMSE